MKTTLINFTVLFLMLAGRIYSAETATGPEQVLFKAGQVIMVQNGKHMEATNDFALTQDITVMTNGTFSVQKRAPRPFQEGDTLGVDGMLLRADGSIAPVIDHIVMQYGKPRLVRDGKSSPLTREYVLGDGTHILPDATIIPPDGRRARLMDGQLYKLDGLAVPTKDTIQLQKGKVRVFKDGSTLTLPLKETIMMSEGTKVFGDGTLLKPDGTRITLKEGEVVRVDGVVTWKP
jgi:hypothetical protein